MTNMTLAIPEELHQVMKKHKEVKWSEIARQALWTQARKVELMDKILVNSELTEEDAENIGHKIKQEIAKKHGLTQ
jgi:hypothetical protein|tara:strand:- start:9519 stop:9746 length:228 start_codon:yes stop_codon:yes gene_type:complete